MSPELGEEASPTGSTASLPAAIIRIYGQQINLETFNGIAVERVLCRSICGEPLHSGMHLIFIEPDGQEKLDDD